MDFRLDLTEEILEEKGYYDRPGRALKAAMEEQRTKARGARKVTNYMGADANGLLCDRSGTLQLHLSDMTVSDHDSEDNCTDQRDRDCMKH